MLEVAVSHRLGAFTLDAAFASGAGLTALFGRSGSGKTSLINAIAGLIRPGQLHHVEPVGAMRMQVEFYDHRPAVAA